MRTEDLTGQTFGRWTVLYKDEEKSKEKKHSYYYCQCSCEKGTIRSVAAAGLKNGSSKSCGCISQEKRKARIDKDDLVGQKFFMLTVLERDYSKPKGKRYWLCRCDCGKITSVNTSNLRSGRVKTCGCTQKRTDLLNKKIGLWTVIGLNKEKTKEKKYPMWDCICECGSKGTFSTNTLTSGHTLSCGCRKISHGEYKIEKALKELGIDYKKQYVYNDLKGDSYALKFDFAIFKDNKVCCLIEYQGEQHYFPVSIFGGEKGFLKQKEYDERKREYCNINQIKLIEIPYTNLKQINNDYLKLLLEEYL